MREPPSVARGGGEAGLAALNLPGEIGERELELEGEGGDVRSRAAEEPAERGEAKAVEPPELLLQILARKGPPLLRKPSLRRLEPRHPSLRATVGGEGPGPAAAEIRATHRPFGPSPSKASLCFRRT